MAFLPAADSLTFVATTKSQHHHQPSSLKTLTSTLPSSSATGHPHPTSSSTGAPLQTLGIITSSSSTLQIQNPFLDLSSSLSPPSAQHENLKGMGLSAAADPWTNTQPAVSFQRLNDLNLEGDRWGQVFKTGIRSRWTSNCAASDIGHVDDPTPPAKHECNHHLGVLSKVKMKKVMRPRRKMREPRFCFKTMSDVDVLDDGYKWRKYGQKVVKNTQHPRSYYRCTKDNCRVKKKVERLAEDPRMVMTTYEGRHAHSPSHDDNLQDDSHGHVLYNNTFFWYQAG